VPEDAAKARLDFIYRLRDEKKFESPDELKAQIARDVGRANKFFRMLG
jgi:FAD synthase